MPSPSPEPQVLNDRPDPIGAVPPGGRGGSGPDADPRARPMRGRKRKPEHRRPATLEPAVQALRESVRESAENRPGVYRLIGPGDELLYVGKSIRVRTRLLSYFRAPRPEKAWEMVRAAERIEWEYIPDEFGALVREMRLIQRHRPRYNVQHKRKRRFAFVKITNEPAPRVVATRNVVRDGAIYFGPFPAMGRVGETVRDLAHLLGLRDCAGPTPIHFADQTDLFGPDRTPGCLRADLGSCLAPCCGRTDERDYRERVAEARRFIEGQSIAPVELLEAKMREAAGRTDFEYAAILRDRMIRLQRFQEDLIAFKGRIRELTFVYRPQGHGEGEDPLYLILRGRVQARLKAPQSRAERKALRARVAEAYSGPDVGPGGLNARQAAEILLVARWFRMKPEEMERTEGVAGWLG